jgi:hypothetical protein
LNHTPTATLQSVTRALWPCRLGAALGLIVSLAAGWRALQLTEADGYTAAYRDRLPMWAAGTKVASPEELAGAERDLKRALEVRPHDGGSHETLGALYTMRALQDWDAAPQRTQWLEAAKAEFMASARLRPFLPQPHANLALLTSMQPEVPANEVFRHWNAALALGPHEKDTRIQLLNVALAMWEEAPPATQNWVKQLRASHVYSEATWQRWGTYYGIESMQ